MLNKLVVIGSTVTLLTICAGLFIKSQFFTNSLSYEQLSKYAYQTLELDNGMTVNYRVEGHKNSDTLLLIHGGFDSIDGWNDWIPTLAEHFHVVAVDMPGHGLTDPHPTRDYSRYAMSEFIHQVVEKLELKNLVIAGHSMGGEYSLQYTIDHPEQIAGVVIVAAGGYVDEAATVNAEQDLLALANSPLAPLFYTFGTEEDFKESFVEYMNFDADEHPKFFRRIFDLSRYEKHRDTAMMLIKSMYKNPHNLIGLDQIQVPTLILWGDQDTVALPEHANRFDRDISDTTLIIYPGVAHGLQLETKQRGAKDVVKFVHDRVFQKHDV